MIKFNLNILCKYNSHKNYSFIKVSTFYINKYNNKSIVIISFYYYEFLFYFNNNIASIFYILYNIISLLYHKITENIIFNYFLNVYSSIYKIDI